jgi:hypothetical protein
VLWWDSIDVFLSRDHKIIFLNQYHILTASVKKEHFYGGAKIVFLFVIVQYLVIEKPTQKIAPHYLVGQKNIDGFFIECRKEQSPVSEKENGNEGTRLSLNGCALFNYTPCIK